MQPKNKAKPAHYICATCHTRTNGLTKTPGNLITEILLWLCWIIPGIIYSLWRHTNRHRICPACKSPRLINLNTPTGQRLNNVNRQ